jgi:hypothetical protein
MVHLLFVGIRIGGGMLAGDKPMLGLNRGEVKTMLMLERGRFQISLYLCFLSAVEDVITYFQDTPCNILDLKIRRSMIVDTVNRFAHPSSLISASPGLELKLRSLISHLLLRVT